MNRKITDLQVHTLIMGSFLIFSPTINLFIDFLHSLSMGRTRDSVEFVQGLNSMMWLKAGCSPQSTRDFASRCVTRYMAQIDIC